MKQYEITKKVYMQDTDCMEQMYHGRYLDWFVEARTEMLEHYLEKPIQNIGMGFIVHSVWQEFYKPLVLGDYATINVQVLIKSKTSLELIYHVTKKDIEGKDIEISQCAIVLVCVREGRIIRIPKNIEDIIENG